MPGNLCTSAIVLAAAGLGLFTMAVTPSDEPTLESAALPVNASSGVAINGYDPVAYFTDGEPVRGTPCLEMEYQGAAYRFSSQENLDRFALDPSAFLPQLGGFSVFGMAKGKRYDVNPTSFDIIDGKLYLSRNKKVRQLWQANPNGYLGRAEENWRALYAP
jgi:YHS domain-containing protein